MLSVFRYLGGESNNMKFIKIFFFEKVLYKVKLNNVLYK